MDSKTGVTTPVGITPEKVTPEATEEKEKKSSFTESKLKEIWTGNLLNVKDKHFYDALSVFFGEIINNENAQTMTFYDVLHKAEENSTEIETAKSKTKQASYIIDEVKSEKNINYSARLKYYFYLKYKLSNFKFWQI